MTGLWFGLGCISFVIFLLVRDLWLTHKRIIETEKLMTPTGKAVATMIPAGVPPMQAFAASSPPSPPTPPRVVAYTDGNIIENLRAWEKRSKTRRQGDALYAAAEIERLAAEWRQMVDAINGGRHLQARRKAPKPLQLASPKI